MRKAIAVYFAVVFVGLLILARLQTFPGGGSLTGETWQWTELQDDRVGIWNDSTLVVPDPEHYTMVFNPDGTAVLVADCNRVPTWTWETTGRSILLQSHAEEWSTCGAGSLAQTLVDVLWRSDFHSVGSGTLVLETKHGGGWLISDTYRLTFKAR